MIQQMIYRFIKKIDTKNKLGKRVINFLITDEKRRKLRKKLRNYQLDRERTKTIRQASNAKATHLEDILQVCLQHIAPVTAPLVLISQLSHSGGSLLSRLFDGHTSLHAYPCAFPVEAFNKGSWPPVDIEGNSRERLNKIYQAMDLADARKGLEQQEDKTRSPFMYLPVLEREIFKKYLESVESLNMRQVFNAHMTAFFGAWLNYQNHRPDKKFVTAYASRSTKQSEVINNFFEIYPDGKLVSIVRKPEDWFASVCELEPEIYRDIEYALGCWQESVQAATQIRKQFGDRVCLINFDDLVLQTESVMRFLSEFLGLPYEDILLQQTFNGLALDTPAHLSKAPEKLNEDQRKLIKEITGADYRAVQREIVVL